MSGALDPLGFGPRIAELRQRSGLTQVAFAKRIGMGQPEVSRLEHGQRRFTVEDAIRIADAFGLSVDALLGRDSAADGDQDALARTSLARIHEITSSFAAAVS